MPRFFKYITMLNVSNLSISFQGETLFSDVAFMLNGGNRVGIIGKNGAGKSTLLKILSGEIQPDTGNIALEKNAKIGYLKQDIDFVQGRTVLEEAYQAFTNLMSLEEELDRIHLEMTERTDYESESYNELLIRLHEVTHQYEIYEDTLTKEILKEFFLDWDLSGKISTNKRIASLEAGVCV